MPNVFDGYCYSTLGEALTAEISKPIQVTGLNQAAAPYSYAGSGTQGGVITFRNPDGSSFSVLKTYPLCTTVGSLTNPNFQLSQLDGNTIAAAFLGGFGFLFLPMATIWAVKHVLGMLR